MIVDRTTNRIRKVSPDGAISTIAGGGAELGDGRPATSGRLKIDCCIYYVSDAGNRRVRRIYNADVH